MRLRLLPPNRPACAQHRPFIDVCVLSYVPSLESIEGAMSYELLEGLDWRVWRQLWVDSFIGHFVWQSQGEINPNCFEVLGRICRQLQSMLSCLT